MGFSSVPFAPAPQCRAATHPCERVGDDDIQGSLAPASSRDKKQLGTEPPRPFTQRLAAWDLLATALL